MKATFLWWAEITPSTTYICPPHSLWLWKLIGLTVSKVQLLSLGRTTYYLYLEKDDTCSDLVEQLWILLCPCKIGHTTCNTSSSTYCAAGQTGPRGTTIGLENDTTDQSGLGCPGPPGSDARNCTGTEAPGMPG